MTNSHPSFIGMKATATVEVNNSPFNSVVVGLNYHSSIGGDRSQAVNCKLKFYQDIIIKDVLEWYEARSIIYMYT